MKDSIVCKPELRTGNLNILNSPLIVTKLAWKLYLLLCFKFNMVLINSLLL